MMSEFAHRRENFTLGRSIILPKASHPLYSDVTAHRLELAEGATVQSRFVCSTGKEYPAAFTYENSEGHRFLVFCVRHAVHRRDYIQVKLCVSKIFVRRIEWFQRKTGPAFAPVTLTHISCARTVMGEYAVGLLEFVGRLHRDSDN